jgi:ubiquinone biosynthesis protein
MSTSHLAEPTRSRDRLEPPRHHDRKARRFRQIAGVAVRYGLADQLRRIPGRRVQHWLRGSAGEDVGGLGVPVRIRLALSELGTTFIKLGQMLSTRSDLVGREVARELARLQSDAPPDPPGVAEATIEGELGKPPAALFAHFESTPFASGSIAQVHHARLHTGENVVVKVQKEGIESQVETDLDILSDLAEPAERHIPSLKLYHPVAVVRQFTRMMRRELDFGRELRNLQQFGRSFAADDSVHFPVPFPEYSTRRVLTMERIEGVLVSQIKLLPELQPELDEFARRGANMYLEMIFRDSFYHADPHPGNLMLLPGQVVGVLDAGMAQRLDDGVRELVEDLLLAYAHGDAEAMTDAVCDLSTSPPIGRRQQLHGDIVELLDDYAEEALGAVDVAALTSSLLEIIHRNRLFLPPAASLLLRMLGTLEGTAKLVNPSFDLFELIQPYADRAARRRFAPRRAWLQIQRDVREWHRLARSFPRDLNELLQRMRSGTFSVHLEHRRLDPVVNRLVLGLLTSSLLLGSSLLWSMRAAPIVRGVPLLGAAGYAVAVLMGLRLFGEIRRSERKG